MKLLLRAVQGAALCLAVCVAGCGTSPTAAPVVDRSPNARPPAAVATKEAPKPYVPPAPAAPVSTPAAPVSAPAKSVEPAPAKPAEPAAVRSAEPAPVRSAEPGPVVKAAARIGSGGRAENRGTPSETLPRRRLASGVPRRQERRHAVQHRAGLRSGLPGTGGLERPGRCGRHQDRPAAAIVSAGRGGRSADTGRRFPPAKPARRQWRYLSRPEPKGRKLPYSEQALAQLKMPRQSLRLPRCRRPAWRQPPSPRRRNRPWRWRPKTRRPTAS